MKNRKYLQRKKPIYYIYRQRKKEGKTGCKRAQKKGLFVAPLITRQMVRLLRAVNLHFSLYWKSIRRLGITRAPGIESSFRGYLVYLLKIHLRASIFLAPMACKVFPLYLYRKSERNRLRCIDSNHSHHSVNRT